MIFLVWAVLGAVVAVRAQALAGVGVATPVVVVVVVPTTLARIKPILRV
ncbi:hypothetical protein [Spirosoma pomorum]